MKYGVREICQVVLKTRSDNQVVCGHKYAKAGTPVLFFDTLKTSSLEGSTTTVYAQGGRGNVKLVAWEGEKNITFTMEDALISPISLSILTAASQETAEKTTLYEHKTEIVMGTELSGMIGSIASDNDHKPYFVTVDEHDNFEGYAQELNADSAAVADTTARYFVDYYVTRVVENQTMCFDITPESFGGNFYLEAATLFRNQDGKDYPAEFILPNCKIQSNFTFTMAATGDPSTFTFTIDAFPAHVDGEGGDKVLCRIKVIDDSNDDTAAAVKYVYVTDSDDKPTNGSIVTFLNASNQVVAITTTNDGYASTSNTNATQASIQEIGHTEGTASTLYSTKETAKAAAIELTKV